jgi:serine/threonine protein kinase
MVSKSSLQKSNKQDNFMKKRKLQDEIQIHKGLQHPNIVNFEHFFEDEENVYILMELCPNKSLNDLLRQRGWLTELECRYFVWQVVDAVRYMHDNLILHRDLKLSNVFLSQDMQVKIGDFGLAVPLKEENELRYSFLGTPGYMAPEIV